MTESITNIIYAVIKDYIFDFHDLKRSILRRNQYTQDTIYSIISDNSLLKDKIYDQILVFEGYAKRIFVKKFIEILTEYQHEEELLATIKIEILKCKKVDLKSEESGFISSSSLLPNILKIGYYDLSKLDFDLDKISVIYYKAYWDKIVDILRFLNEVNLDMTIDYKIEEISVKSTNKVFIVHGHDKILELEVARFVDNLKLCSVILHEQENSGNTIIEKIEKNSDVQYAIILLTDDDLGKGKKEKNYKPRARQNVIAEMGYFTGLLGRKNIVCLVNNDSIEIPSDFNGIAYISIKDNWKIKLAKELKMAGFEVDM